ncbi:hypothetical protein CHLNCDRAFT_26480, partial [Chlorella variabilis]
GALIAAATDLSFNPRGYAAVLCNDLLTSLYLIMVKNTPGTNGLSTTGMLFYNSMLSLPMLLCAVVLKGEPGGMAGYPMLWHRTFQMVLLASSALGLTINHSTFVCTRVNEPLMTSVAGNLKNAIMTIVGAFSFGDFIFEPWNAAGLTVSMAGAVWYAMRSALRVRVLAWHAWRHRCRHWACPASRKARPCPNHAKTGVPPSTLDPPLHADCPQARQKSIKDRLLQQVPVIGRDRLKGRADGVQLQLTGAPNGFTASGASSAHLSAIMGSHSRSNSRGDLSHAGQQP